MHALVFSSLAVKGKRHAIVAMSSTHVQPKRREGGMDSGVAEVRKKIPVKSGQPAPVVVCLGKARAHLAAALRGIAIGKPAGWLAARETRARDSFSVAPPRPAPAPGLL